MRPPPLRATPIRHYSIGRDGAVRRNDAGVAVRRTAGISFLTDSENRTMHWPARALTRYRVVNAPGRTADPLYRQLPFELADRTFAVVTHANQYGIWMAGQRQSLPGQDSLTRVSDSVAVAGEQLAQAVLADETYQAAVRRDGDALEVVLVARRSLPDAIAFARALGRPVWAADGPVGVHFAELSLTQEGSREPRWYLVQPDGTPPGPYGPVS